MSIESRITKIEMAIAEKPTPIGPQVRAEVRRLTEEPHTVESLRLAAVAADCNPSLRSLVDSQYPSHHLSR